MIEVDGWIFEVDGWKFKYLDVFGCELIYWDCLVSMIISCWFLLNCYNSLLNCYKSISKCSICLSINVTIAFQTVTLGSNMVLEMLPHMWDLHATS